MPILNNALDIKLGDKQILSVWFNGERVWPDDRYGELENYNPYILGGARFTSTNSEDWSLDPFGFNSKLVDPNS